MVVFDFEDILIHRCFLLHMIVGFRVDMCLDRWGNWVLVFLGGVACVALVVQVVDKGCRQHMVVVLMSTCLRRRHRGILMDLRVLLGAVHIEVLDKVHRRVIQDMNLLSMVAVVVQAVAHGR